MCLTFDRNDAFASENGVYIDPQDVAISNNGLVGKAAYFNGASSNIEVPAFSNKVRPCLFVCFYLYQIQMITTDHYCCYYYYYYYN